MSHRIRLALLLLATLSLFTVLISGCGPKPPLPYQTLQVQDSEEAQGYDVYMYISIEKGKPSGDVTKLLEWFRDVKYADVNKMRIFVWDNPQSALVGATGDLVATLNVDREQEIDEITINTENR